MTKVLSSTCEVAITFGDLDPMGIVWHGNYIKFLEHGREAFGRDHGMDAMDMYHLGFSTPIVRSQVDHKAMLEYGDSVVIQTRYVPTAAAKIVLRYTLRSKGTGRIVAEAETIQVFLDKERRLQLLPPAFYQAWKQKFEVE
ncbi:MAG: acyl-CoA thioesterase [Flavobacteriales bacterium]|nr:acyl-CoA thioesterase [Flavobacteriales bacterium]